MVDLKLGAKTYSGIDRLQISKADSSGVVDFMESDSFNTILSGGAVDGLYENPYLTKLGKFFPYFASFTTVYLPNVTQLSDTNVGSWQSCVNLIMPKLESAADQLTWASNTLKVVDFSSLTAVGTYGLNGNKLTSIILRGNTVPTIGNVANQSANKPTVYVPSAMLSAYNADSSWSSLVSTKEWTITALEGSQYEDPDWFRT